MKTFKQSIIGLTRTWHGLRRAVGEREWNKRDQRKGEGKIEGKEKEKRMRTALETK